MLLWQVSWSHCAKPSPEQQLFVEGDRLTDEATLIVIDSASNYVLETPWVISLGRFDSYEAI
jgi:hypothetical protein